MYEDIKIDKILTLSATVLGDDGKKHRIEIVVLKGDVECEINHEFSRVPAYSKSSLNLYIDDLKDHEVRIIHEEE